MKVFLGGIAAAFLGIIGMFVFMGPFLHLACRCHPVDALSWRCHGSLPGL